MKKSKQNKISKALGANRTIETIKVKGPIDLFTLLRHITIQKEKLETVKSISCGKKWTDKSGPH